MDFSFDRIYFQIVEMRQDIIDAFILIQLILDPFQFVDIRQGCIDIITRDIEPEHLDDQALFVHPAVRHFLTVLVEGDATVFTCPGCLFAGMSEIGCLAGPAQILDDHAIVKCPVKIFRQEDLVVVLQDNGGAGIYGLGGAADDERDQEGCFHFFGV